MKIICFGDSITESGATPNGWCKLLQNQLNAESPGAHQVVVAGFSGRHSGELLDRMGEFVLPHLPGTVLIVTGINDSYHQAWQRIPRVSLEEYRRNLTEMVRIVREHSSNPILVGGHELRDRGIFKQGNGRPQPENYAPYAQAIRELAHALNIPLIDIAAKLKAVSIPPESILADDGVHLSAQGHSQYAHLIREALGHL